MGEISIKLDKNGRWFINGEPVEHERMSLFFARSIIKEGEEYYIKIGDKKIPIQVEDTPFIVQSVSHRGGRYFIHLNDGSMEVLDPSTLWVGGENVLYCYVKNRFYIGRFSRPAYYQIAEHIKQDENNYFLIAEGKKYYIKT